MRKKPGPKPKYKETMTEQVKVRFTPEQKAQLDKIAGELGKDLIDLLRDGVLASAEEIAATGNPGVLVDWSSGKATSFNTSEIVELAVGTPLSEKPEFKKMVKELEDQAGDDET